MPFYAIVVKVPDPQEHCFVAMPFEGFEPVFNAIKEAARRQQLLAVRVRSAEMQQGVDFVEDVRVAARTARVVVAVVSPVKDSDAAPGAPPRLNPNVLYELGLADALGKPAVIMTNDLKSLPSDLKTRHVLEYADEEVESEGFYLKIQNRIYNRVREMPPTNPLTDPAYTDISVAQERHLMLLNPAFWDNFRTVLSFAKTIHDEIQGLDTAHIEKILRAGEDVFFNPGELSRIRTFTENWNAYDTYFQVMTKVRVFDRLEDLLGANDASFDFLAEQAKSSGDPMLAGRVKTARGFYQIIKDRLREFNASHTEIGKNHIGFGALSLLKDADKSQNMYGEVVKFSSTTKTIIIQSDRLIVNLSEMILKTGD